MPKKKQVAPPSTPEALRFARIVEKTMLAGRPDRDGSDIGTLREKRLHAIIKRYLCEDTTCHERPVPDLLAEGKPPRGKGMIADIMTDGQIFEVQTGGFYPLRKKVDWYLSHTACRVTVVHPVATVRYLSWIAPADGQIISRRRCPSKGGAGSVGNELYWLSDFIGNDRFSIRLLLLEMEEYRMKDGWSRDGKRGSSRYDRVPTAWLGEITLATPADYAAFFLPDTLPDIPFTPTEYAKATGIRGKATYSVLRILVGLGLLTESDKIGRSMGFCRTTPLRKE